uniref:VQ domain-containing protein n=1 Tax=Aegilops tauschii subsp. strangulata TaxID=200361 RepID=A0A453D8L7_AEGTS
LMPSSSSSRAPAPSRGGGSAAARGCVDVDANTTFVQADPATFRALVQRLTGAAGAAMVPVVPMRRPKLQERRRAAPARLELARPQPFYYHHGHQHHHHHHHQHHHGVMQYSPVSTMDYARVSSSASSPSPSPPSSCSCGVVISQEEVEREEKAIASKAFYLHSSPRAAPGAGGDAAERPKLLPLFPVHSPRSSSFA